MPSGSTYVNALQFDLSDMTMKYHKSILLIIRPLGGEVIGPAV